MGSASAVPVSAASQHDRENVHATKGGEAYWQGRQVVLAFPLCVGEERAASYPFEDCTFFFLQKEECVSRSCIFRQLGVGSRGRGRGRECVSRSCIFRQPGVAGGRGREEGGAEESAAGQRAPRDVGSARKVGHGENDAPDGGVFVPQSARPAARGGRVRQRRCAGGWVRG